MRLKTLIHIHLSSYFSRICELTCHIRNFSGSFVTSVGGTNETYPERAVDFSGGDSSNCFDRLSYQSQAVEAFLATFGDKTYAGLYKWVLPTDTSSPIVLTRLTDSASGRGFQDVAAQGLNFQVVVGGKIYAIGGTGAGAPRCVPTYQTDAR